MNKPGYRIASLVATGIAVCGLVFLALNKNLFSSNPFGIAAQVLAVGLMLWARVTFGKRSLHAGANPTEGGLVTSGPYRFLRHPIYAAATYFVWAGALSYRTPEAIVAALVVTLCLTGRMFLEEQFLNATYPEYGEYSKRTKRFIPFLL